ncbi:hypothetical protein C8Q79DRAFT_940259 [Trametes meyenii]|nr:hypothetical protein C8Q79DRAFT_940259 [Trametes meyenii]
MYCYVSSYTPLVRLDGLERSVTKVTALLHENGHNGAAQEASDNWRNSRLLKDFNSIRAEIDKDTTFLACLVKWQSTDVCSRCPFLHYNVDRFLMDTTIRMHISRRRKQHRDFLTR